MIYFTD